MSRPKIYYSLHLAFHTISDKNDIKLLKGYDDIIDFCNQYHITPEKFDKLVINKELENLFW